MSFSLYANKRTIARTIIWFFIIIAGLIIVVMADMATSDWFFLSVGNFMLIGAGIGLLLGISGMIVFFLSGRKYAGFAQWGWGIFVFCLLEIVIAFRLFHYQVAHTIQEATPIIQALEDYYQEHETYPSSLQTLVPGYLSHIPPTKIRWGTESFWYEPGTHRFSLMFLGHVMSICSYTSERPTWECHGT
jgi:hypothetical protein